MFRSYRNAAIAVGAMVAGFGALRTASAAPILIGQDSSAVVDGWDITTQPGISLTVTVSGDQIDIEKTANFTKPNQSIQIGFNEVSASSISSIDLTNETVFNNTGSPFGEFDFLLQNVGTANASFSGDVFVNGIGSTPGTLSNGGQQLTYLGNQASGATSVWGNTTPTDDLFIAVPAGAVFSLDEASSAGGHAVPLPAAAWQSLIGLAGLGIIGLARQRKVRRPA